MRMAEGELADLRWALLPGAPPLLPGVPRDPSAGPGAQWGPSCDPGLGADSREGSCDSVVFSRRLYFDRMVMGPWVMRLQGKGNGGQPRVPIHLFICSAVAALDWLGEGGICPIQCNTWLEIF